MTAGDDGQPRAPVLGRRQMLGVLGAGAVGVGLGVGAVTTGVLDRRDEASARSGSDTVKFYDTHQAGIATPVQSNLHFAAFDMVNGSRDGLVDLLKRWTTAAASLCAGELVGDANRSELAPPDDNGESLGLSASRLTLTVGFGPTLFDNRFGLSARRPAALVDLPRFPADALNPERCDGDLAIQACADDPQVAIHAIRILTRLATGTAAVRWTQLGYGRAATISPNQQTPRNLFGFKDGTANPSAKDTATLNDQVWVGAADDTSDAAWMSGGSYLVARRIAMRIETWDRTSLEEQEEIIGRTKVEGVAFGQKYEHDEIDLTKVPATAHVALAHPSNHDGAQLLRRGYNFVDGTDSLGHFNAGLFFLAYQRDPRKQFIPIQHALATSDELNEYVQHTGSGIWAVPPGVASQGFWGDTLLT